MRRVLFPQLVLLLCARAAEKCRVAPLSLAQLVEQEPTFRKAIADDVSPWRLPSESAAGIDTAFEKVVAASGCRHFSLACPAHGEWVGQQLAAVFESVRRKEADISGLCSSRYALIDYDGWADGHPGALDTPGSSLLRVNHAVTRIRSYLPGGRILGFRLPMKYLGTLWFSALFGDLTEGTCVEEIQAFCGPEIRQLGPIALENPHCDETESLEAERRVPSVGPAGFWLTQQEIKAQRIPKTDPRDLWPTPLSCSTVASFRRDYARARLIVPIAPLFPRDKKGEQSRRKRLVNVVVHARGGKGSRSPPEAAFLPVLAATCDALRVINVEWRVTVVTEEPPGSFPAFENLKNFTVKYDANRYAMWHSLWEADVVLSGFSTYSLMAGMLSPKVKVLVAGLDWITSGYFGKLGPCRGLVPNFPMAWLPCLEPHTKRTYENAFHSSHFRTCPNTGDDDQRQQGQNNSSGYAHAKNAASSPSTMGTRRINRRRRLSAKEEGRLPPFVGTMIPRPAPELEDSPHRRAPDYYVYKHKYPFQDCNSSFGLGLDRVELGRRLAAAFGTSAHHLLRKKRARTIFADQSDRNITTLLSRN